jgi:hypothetical protein
MPYLPQPPCGGGWCRGALLELYRARYGKLPTVAAILCVLPDPADHPIFRITDSSPGPVDEPHRARQVDVAPIESPNGTS